MHVRRNIPLLIAALLLRASVARADCTEPGKARWGAKSSVPLHSSIIHARLVSLDRLMAMADPVPKIKRNQPAHGLIPPFDNPLHVKEGNMLRTRGYLRLVATEGNDCEYHMQLTRTPTSQSSFIIEVARDDASSIRSTWLRNRARLVRRFIRDSVAGGQEPELSHVQLLPSPPYVEVVGQLFFDSAHGSAGERGKAGLPAATLWELHPVVDIHRAKPPR